MVLESIPFTRGDSLISSYSSFKNQSSITMVLKRTKTPPVHHYTDPVSSKTPFHKSKGGIRDKLNRTEIAETSSLLLKIQYSCA